MKKLASWYLDLSETKQNVFILVAVGLLAFLPSLFLFLVPINWVRGIPLGILLGTAIEIGCYLSIVGSSKGILEASKGKKGAVAKTILMMFARYALYAGGLILAAFCQFKWQVGYLNVFAVFGAYLPVYIVLIVRGAKAKKATKVE